MATWTAAPSRALLRRRTPAAPVRGVPRGRWSLAGMLEILFEPTLAPHRRFNHWPRIPYANRVAMAEPLQEIASLLRDPEIEIPEEAQERIRALATHPASPAFGSYPIQARFAAFSLVDELRTLPNDIQS